MRSRRALVGTGGALGVSVLAGCAGLLGSDDEEETEEVEPPVEAFELSITDVRSPDTGLTSATVPVVFEVTNTHDEHELPAPTLDYAAVVGDHEVLSARQDLPTLGPGDNSRETVELILDYAELGSSIVDAVLDETFTLEIRGEIVSEGVSAAFSDRYDY